MAIETGSTLPSTPLYHLPPAVDGACSYAPEKIDINTLEKPLLVVIVPGAFTPTCSEQHIPPYLTTSAVSHLKEAGIKQVLVLSTDSPFITRAWGDQLVSEKKEVQKVLQDGYIKFVSDAGAEWLSEAGLVGEPKDLFAKNGLRGLRTAIITDASGKVTYVGVDKNPGSVEQSGIDGVLAALKK
jgi:alkyl hydroperoxide reductase 1